MKLNLPPEISVEEGAEVLRRIARGEISIAIDDWETWTEIRSGHVRFVLSDGGEFVMFNDVNELDYIESMRLADGRQAVDDEWLQVAWEAAAGGPVRNDNPIDLLSDEEEAALKKVIEAARPLQARPPQ